MESLTTLQSGIREASQTSGMRLECVTALVELAEVKTGYHTVKRYAQ
jgi:hypothetical protein